MNKLFTCLLLSLPFMSTYAAETEKINLKVPNSPSNASYSSGINGNVNLTFVKAWTTNTQQKLVDDFKASNNQIPPNSKIIFKESKTTPSFLKPKDYSADNSFSFNFGINKEYEPQYISSSPAINAQSDFTYGQVINPICRSLFVGVYTKYSEVYISTPPLIVTKTSIMIEDKYTEFKNYNECKNTPSLETQLTFNTLNSFNDLRIQSINSDKANYLVKGDDQTSTIILPTNIYKKDKNGQISYLSYFFFFNLN